MVGVTNTGGPKRKKIKDYAPKKKPFRLTKPGEKVAA